ncbi:unnamed protein product [Rhizophagus irregularis]|nr:unnamed protein product [Rhizophagus irregularis]CAB4440285.1 unnamed protein product [Rhizophagus irregularis]
MFCSSTLGLWMGESFERLGYSKMQFFRFHLHISLRIHVKLRKNKYFDLENFKNGINVSIWDFKIKAYIWYLSGSSYIGYWLYNFL